MLPRTQQNPCHDKRAVGQEDTEAGMELAVVCRVRRRYTSGETPDVEQQSVKSAREREVRPWRSTSYPNSTLHSLTITRG
jgi:hypothetical protein